MSLSLKMKIFRVLAVVGSIGLVGGLVARLLLVGNRSNAEIIPSGIGLIAFAGIGLGLAGMAAGWSQDRPLRLVLSTVLVCVSIMWVIPLPH